MVFTPKLPSKTSQVVWWYAINILNPSDEPRFRIWSKKCIHFRSRIPPNFLLLRVLATWRSAPPHHLRSFAGPFWGINYIGLKKEFLVIPLSKRWIYPFLGNSIPNPATISLSRHIYPYPVTQLYRVSDNA